MGRGRETEGGNPVKPGKTREQRLDPGWVRVSRGEPEPGAATGEPDQLHQNLLKETREGNCGPLRDLQDLYLMGNFCDVTWTIIGQAA